MPAVDPLASKFTDVDGVGAEGLEHWEADGLVRRDPTGWQAPLPGDGVVERTCRAMNLSGPSIAVSAACASGDADGLTCET